MIDEPEIHKDARIANHIASVHRCALRQEEDEEEEEIEAPTPPYSRSQMQLYIKYIRTIKPKLTAQVCAFA